MSAEFVRNALVDDPTGYTIKDSMDGGGAGSRALIACFSVTVNSVRGKLNKVYPSPCIPPTLYFVFLNPYSTLFEEI